MNYELSLKQLVTNINFVAHVEQGRNTVKTNVKIYDGMLTRTVAEFEVIVMWG